MCIYGYVRVSSKEQNTDRQMLTMKGYEVPVNNIYVDKQSGKDFDRMAYRKLIDKIKPGDLIYVKSIDRLGRNYRDIQEQWRLITQEKQTDICVIDMPLLDTRNGKDLMGTFISDIVLQLLSFVAENERINIKSRQAEGIAAAKIRGVKFGRPPIYKDEEMDAYFDLYEEKQVSLAEILSELGISRTTFYRRLKDRKMVKK